MKIRKKNIILIISFALLFFLFNFLNLFNSGFFNSPDENVNYVFIKNFAENNSLTINLAKDYGIFSEFIHPRSAFVIENGGKEIIPVSFLGIIFIYGFLAKIFSIYLIPFLTSILTILSGLAFYNIIEKIWNKKIAWFSAILYYIQPAIFYYTARSFFPNMPFVSLIIISLFFLLNKPILNKFNKKYLDDVFGFIILGLGILIRPSEIIWLFISGLVLLFAYKKKTSDRTIAIWGAITFLFILLFLCVNNFVYGNLIGTYVSSNSLAVSSKLSYIFPFGFNLNLILSSGYFYFVKLFLPFVLLSLTGIFIFLFDWIKNKTINKEQKIYFILFSFVSVFLFIYYGSYKTEMYYQKTIGVAYDRYWLPILIMSLPFVAYFLEFIKNKLKFKKDYFSYVIVFILALFSLKLVFASPNGLLYINEQLSYQKELRSDILYKYGNDIIIITDAEDKFFWPDIQVVVRFFDSNVGKNIRPMLENNYKMYYFTYKDEKRLFQAKDYLDIYNLGLEKVEKYRDHDLYKIIIKN